MKNELPLDVVKKLKIDCTNDGSLSEDEKDKLIKLKDELITYLIKQYELNENKVRPIEKTQDVLKRVMNPASHASLVPLYESELNDAIAGVKQLQEHLNADQP